MYKTPFIQRPPCPNTVLTALGVIVSITAISAAANLYYERCRRKQLARTLATHPGASDILPHLDENSRGLLASLGKIIPPTS
jgi:hypothetical protein